MIYDFCTERLGLGSVIVDDILRDLSAAVPGWKDLRQRCQLPAAKKTAYLELLAERLARLGLLA
ncbi:MAG: hypothetical protein NTW21_32855 [Verrucomicrobia bacterium]|nr:hypothetical protein [Verrucomicrobiota bacterium]